jgi:hypothetical protein
VNVVHNNKYLEATPKYYSRIFLFFSLSIGYMPILRFFATKPIIYIKLRISTELLIYLRDSAVPISSFMASGLEYPFPFQRIKPF